MVGGKQRIRQRNVITSKTKVAANRTEVLNDAHGEAGVRGFIKRNITPARRSANGRRSAEQAFCDPRYAGEGSREARVRGTGKGAGGE